MFLRLTRQVANSPLVNATLPRVLAKARFTCDNDKPPSRSYLASLFKSELHGNINDIVIDWTIKNFPFFRHRNDLLRSSGVQLSKLGFACGKGEWCVALRPFDAACATSKPAVSAYIELCNADSSLQIPATFSIAILDGEGKVKKLLGETGPFQPKVFGGADSNTHGFANAISQDEIFANNGSFLLDGSLIVRAKISFMSDTETPRPPVPVKEPTCDMPPPRAPPMGRDRDM